MGPPGREGSPGKDVSLGPGERLRRNPVHFHTIPQQQDPLYETRLPCGVPCTQLRAAAWAPKGTSAPHGQLENPGLATPPLALTERGRWALPGRQGRAGQAATGAGPGTPEGGQRTLPASHHPTLSTHNPFSGGLWALPSAGTWLSFSFCSRTSTRGGGGESPLPCPRKGPHTWVTLFPLWGLRQGQVQGTAQ